MHQCLQQQNGQQYLQSFHAAQMRKVATSLRDRIPRVGIHMVRLESMHGRGSHLSNEMVALELLHRRWSKASKAPAPF